jgi:hypothetical protein
MDSDVLVDFSGRADPVSAEPIVSAKNITLKSNAGQVGFPWAGISGKIRVDTDNRPVVNLVLKGSKGKISSDPFKTEASGIEFELPILYPFAPQKTDPKNPDGIKSDGKYSIPSILVDNQYRVSTSGKIRQTGLTEVRIIGEAAVNELPDLRAEFAAQMGFERELDASFEFKTNLVHLNTSDLAAFIPQKFQAADIDMRVSAAGTAAFHHGRLTTSLQLGVQDGRIVLPEVNLIAAGINTRVAFTDLGSLAGVPGQILTVDSIEINEIKLENALIRFTVEDPHSLLIENIRFKWCNGLVSTESIRIPQDDVYSLTLYCDRLEMTRLLKQVGGFNAQGSGTLNGRIPLLYSKGNISFDNGFLFSTPGSGGKLMIQNTERITKGIPMDNPQFAQLDLAQEALKDFDYQWAKLIFNTFDNTLDLKMEVDGKPSKVLPFEYKKEFNGFRRVDASSPGSLFEGITLDVNLKLPFNEVMEFGNRIKSFLN